ncbi:MAG: hypothetical protein QOF93_811 [Verrucomicrobiota bacterium]|jgi:hypothetical protein
MHNVYQSAKFLRLLISDESQFSSNLRRLVQRHTHYDAFLGLAGASFVAVIGALSVNTYDWTVITGIAILSADIPLLISFARWDPPTLRRESPLPDHISNILWIASMPAALLGISFILAHVHIICGILFAVASCLAYFLYQRRLNELKRTQRH